MLRRIAIGLVLAALVALPATAQDHQKGVAAYKRGDYATALKEWRPLAERGHANAQDNLGLMYTKGLGVPQDFVLAHKWFNIGAIEGNEDARKSRDNVEKIMTPQDVSEAQRLVREWLAKQNYYAEILRVSASKSRQSLFGTRVN